MRKLIVLLWVVFLPITSILAQSNKEKQEAYKQLKEWAVVKLTIAYIEDLRQFTPEEKGESGSKKEYETYKVLINNYQDYSNEINLENVGQLLESGSWGVTKKNVFDSYKTLDINSDYNFNSVKTSGYTEVMSKQSFDKTITVLENKYKELLNNKSIVKEKSASKKIIVESKIEPPVLEPIPENVIEGTRKINLDFPLWVFGVLGVLIVAIVIIFRLISKNNKLNDLIKKEKNNFKKQTSDQGASNPTANKLKQEKQKLISEKERFFRETENYKREIENYKREIENLKNNPISEVERITTSTINDMRSESIELNVSQHKPSNLIYLSSPFQNLTFANEDASKDKTLNSLYLVEFNEQMQTGELSVLVDADLSKALNSPDTYLETACTYDNEYSNIARTIKVTDKGKIKLEGEDWIVTKKVRIEFI